MKSLISISGAYVNVFTPGSRFIVMTDISGSRFTIYSFNTPVSVDFPLPAVPIK